MHRLVTESDRAVVEQAKGVLMLHYGIDSRESRTVLDLWAREALVPLEDVADALIMGICLGQVPHGSENLVRWLEQRLRSGVDDVRGAGDEIAPARATTAGSATPPAPRPEVAAALGHRQWRYTSALHAARVLRSQ